MMGASEARVSEYDIRGQICPSTLLTTLREVNRHKEALRQGELVLKFKTDNRDSTATIPETVVNMGYRVEVVKEGGYYCIIIERKG